jgi:hypothetical protein
MDLPVVVLAATDAGLSQVAQPDVPIEPELRLLAKLGHRHHVLPLLPVLDPLGFLFHLPAQGDGAIGIWAALLRRPIGLELRQANRAFSHAFIPCIAM